MALGFLALILLGGVLLSLNSVRKSNLKICSRSSRLVTFSSAVFKRKRKKSDHHPEFKYALGTDFYAAFKLFYFSFDMLTFAIWISTFSTSRPVIFSIAAFTFS